MRAQSVERCRINAQWGPREFGNQSARCGNHCARAIVARRFRACKARMQDFKRQIWSHLLKDCAQADVRKPRAKKKVVGISDTCRKFMRADTNGSVSSTDASIRAVLIPSAAILAAIGSVWAVRHNEWVRRHANRSHTLRHVTPLQRAACIPECCSKVHRMGAACHASARWAIERVEVAATTSTRLTADATKRPARACATPVAAGASS